MLEPKGICFMHSYLTERLICFRHYATQIHVWLPILFNTIKENNKVLWKNLTGIIDVWLGECQARILWGKGIKLEAKEEMPGKESVHDQWPMTGVWSFQVSEQVTKVLRCFQ
jgi:hypothetical protein